MSISLCSFSVMSDGETCARVKDVLGLDICSWQLAAIKTLLRREKHLVTVVRTGGGKTPPMLAALLFDSTSTVFIIAPRIVREKQHEERFNVRGVTAENATNETFQVRLAAFVRLIELCARCRCCAQPSIALF